MSIVVAALTSTFWDVWVEVKSYIALHHLHCSWKLYVYYYEAVDVSIIMLFNPDD